MVNYTQEEKKKMRKQTKEEKRNAFIGLTINIGIIIFLYLVTPPIYIGSPLLIIMIPILYYSGKKYHFRRYENFRYKQELLVVNAIFPTVAVSQLYLSKLDILSKELSKSYLIATTGVIILFAILFFMGEKHRKF